MARVASQLKRAWPILASAALYSLAFPPFHLGLLVLVSLVPWLISLAVTPSNPKPRGFRSGYLLGFLVVLGQMAFTQTLTVRWTGSVLLSLAPWLVCAFLGAFYFAILGSIFQRAMARGWWFAIPMVLAGMEIFRSYIPGLAFPFFLLGNPLWPYAPLIQSAHWGSVYFVSAWVCLVNVLGVFFLMKVPMRTARPYAIVGLLVLVGSLLRYVEPISGKPTVVVCGQPGVDMAFGDAASRDDRLFAAIASLYWQAKQSKARLLVLPEGMALGGPTLPPRTPFVVQPDQPIIFGARRYVLRGTIPPSATTEQKIFQSAYAYDGKWQFADKARLVVFGEYVPGRKFLPFLDKFKLPNGDLTPSDKTVALTVDGLRVGPLICFEGMFWDVGQKQVENGAQLLTMMSIDDWYIGTAAPDQLKTAAVWRAIETGLPVARAASLGYTMAVDQRGRILSQAPIGKTVGLPVTLMVPDAPPSMPLRPIIVWLLGLSLPGLGLPLLLLKRSSGQR